MKIQVAANKILAFIAQSETLVGVRVAAQYLGLEWDQAEAVLKFVLRRRSSWFTRVTDADGETAFVITPGYIDEAVRFLDMGGFR
jgi:hypothetical protein